MAKKTKKEVTKQAGCRGGRGGCKSTDNLPDKIYCPPKQNK